MNFYMTFKRRFEGNAYANIILKLKLTLIVWMTVILQVSATSYAQITLNEKSARLENVLQKIKRQTGYDFFYNSDMLNKARPITIVVNDVSVEEALDLCFKNQPLSYRIEQKTIVVRYQTERTLAPRDINITGTIVDESGKPIPGATIRIKDSSQQTLSRLIVSNSDGKFSITVNSENDILLVSYVGYKTQEVKLKSIQGPLIVRMEMSETAMKDVVITGTGITRNKNSFTGATASYTGEQLKAVGNQNLIQGLRALDPSFLQLENNRLGSNPNELPNIEIRGKTSISSTLQDQFASDPNQPLFILDGFETSLRTIVDLNINRIGSVTILKDAASTAMYGSKASNGVVVIETVKPKPGQMRLNYSSDFNVEAPDLSGYNMMNAEEKLEFERLSGRYTYFLGANSYPQGQIYLDSIYNVRLAEVRRGVNTYWLNEPVQTGFSQRHSIYADGGDQSLRYGVGATYKKTSGTMKGSGREDWAGNVDLTYRRGRFNISNQLYVNGYKGDESPYGSFANFVNANPYYRKDNPDARYLEESRDNTFINLYKVTNPLYNAALNSINSTKNFAIQNNLQIIVDLSQDLRLQGAVQLQKGVTTGLKFLSPLHTSFDNASIFEKGSYNNSKTDNFSYNANAMLTYGKVLNEVHSLTANLRTDIRHSNNQNIAFSVVGFPASSNGNPSFAYSYQPDSRPATALSTARTNSILASANYAYDGRYLADFSFRYDGSTAFGSNKKYSPYLSGGIGWNVHREDFMESVDWIGTFRLVANIGKTGNQNFASVSSISTYGYDAYINIYGQGVTLNSLGNPNLKWQNSVQTNLGTDLVMFGDKLALNVNIYSKKTDPLVVAVDLPSSTGIKAYPMNAGYLDTKGFEATVKYSLLYRPEDRVIWTLGLTGTAYKSTYGGFNNRLASLNTAQQNSKGLIRYKDGYGPQDIWAVLSKGIDPSTGQEIFLRSDGQYTFTYNTDDIVKVGSEQPQLEGVFSNTLVYKGFNMGVNLRYILGRDVFNSALYNKVENIDVQGLEDNQDKRALYDRWKRPGDISQFKAISLTTETPISSRFVQTENMLSGESISFGYTFQSNGWLKKLGLSSLRMNGYANDIFRFSTVRRERGIEYPFARSVSFSLNAGF
ncbi:SusC/RagA family TonB-linked outer membrane protein [Pedobacter psychroterrae]|uniref:SusC/RagA family TonB-linked outer membrane protein n=1 Tax=Pedobacter psychroterrae TaxID=2530453 RepID=A0A4R0NU60_9SPHI|nr:SusC/RagA family TonB-linked outer membrane protein [Pedobacter psychroterrae]TCD03513.1 SusC/RagA family TonB-linked outer membrane protein [Pedobacter psychroterrae]